MLDEALALVEPNISRIDFTLVSAICFGRLGCIAEQEGDLEAAADWHRRAMEVATPSHHLLMLQPFATVVEGLAALQAARGDHAGAAGLLGTAHSLHGFRDPSSYDVERTEAAVLAAIGREAFDLAYERGRQVSRAEAIALRP